MLKKSTTKPLPGWYYYYFVKYDENNQRLYSSVLDYNFDDLLNIHQNLKKDPYFYNNCYNEENMFSIHRNFFEYFYRNMKSIDNYDLLLQHIHFIEYLLNDPDIYCDIKLSKTDNHDNLLFILTSFKPGFINRLQRTYRKNIHKKKLNRSLVTIILSPPKQVEFIKFNGFHGCILYTNSSEDFNDRC